MTRLYLDTETTGLPQHLPLTDPAQPWLAELGAQLFDETRPRSSEVCGSDHWHELARLDTLIHPEGKWEMPQGPGSAGEKNGLTTELCTAHGIRLHLALTVLGQMLTIADEIVVQNWDFERQILTIAWTRTFGSALVLNHVLARLIIRDTTRIGHELFPHLPFSRHGHGPSLNTLHVHLFGTEHRAHRALPDEIATRRVFAEMLRRSPRITGVSPVVAGVSPGTPHCPMCEGEGWIANHLDPQNPTRCPECNHSLPATAPASAGSPEPAPAEVSTHVMAGAIQDSPTPGNPFDPRPAA